MLRQVVWRSYTCIVDTQLLRMVEVRGGGGGVMKTHRARVSALLRSGQQNLDFHSLIALRQQWDRSCSLLTVPIYVCAGPGVLYGVCGDDADSSFIPSFSLWIISPVTVTVIVRVLYTKFSGRFSAVLRRVFLSDFREIRCRLCPRNAGGRTRVSWKSLQ
jgi:hypothetical protein